MSSPEREKALIVNSVNISMIAWKSLADNLDGLRHRLSGIFFSKVRMKRLTLYRSPPLYMPELLYLGDNLIVDVLTLWGFNVPNMT